jgi:glycosyltransferase involved in cell wall biosynthesis
MNHAPRIAIVHDYLTQRGGAERVVLALLRIFPEARLITSVYREEGTFPEFAEKRVETTWLNHLSLVRQDPRRALPLLAPTFGRMEVADVDVVIASSSGWAHGVQTSAPKIVYCHNPPRWLHQPEEYLAGLGPLAQLASRAMTPYLRRWDRLAAAGTAVYIANSTPVVDRIRCAYGRDALLVPPPVMIDVTGPREPIEGVEPGFLLTVARARGYKNTDVVIDAMSELTGERLVVVGETRQSTRVRGVGRVNDAQMRWLYANCRALVSASYEDFGLTPLEANAFGRPAVVLRAGGFLDTLVEGVTGVFIEEPSAAAVADAVQRLPAVDEDEVRAHTERYSEATFAGRIREIVADVSR